MTRIPKVIADPICGIIDIGPVLPLVETPEFQQLADKRQLSLTSYVFRSATHTRFAHCVGSYHATRILSDKWERDQAITKEEADAISIYALLHDIGHPAFSHTSEDFCSLDDDEMTLKYIQTTLRSSIEECGVNADLVEQLADRSNPLYLAVHDKNLGMEKLDYLERDGFYTLLSRPLGIKYLREHIYFIDGQVAIDEKAVTYALSTLTFYMEMYKDVYFRKSLVIMQRMFHKALYHLILDDEFVGDALITMTDSELFGIMAKSQNPIVKNMYGRLRARNLFKETFVIRPRRFKYETRTAGKSIHVQCVTDEEMDKIVNRPGLQKKDHSGLELLETCISKICGIPEESVLLVPIFDQHRFKAKDVAVLGANNQLCSLRERRPAHFANMDEIAGSHTALRICTTSEYREKLSSQKTAKAILGLFL